MHIELIGLSMKLYVKFGKMENIQYCNLYDSPDK